MEQLAAPPYAILCALFINTGIDPMPHLAKLGKQLASDRSDPLSFASAHTSLVESVEQLITTSSGELILRLGYLRTARQPLPFSPPYATGP